MQGRTPLILITGPLGSGKTTLLRHLIETVPHRLAILMNEFGDIAIDSKIVAGKNVRMAELGGGCVCCSLLGEFEAAVEEVIDAVHPDLMFVETTGVAEPDALIFNIQESVPRVRLDSVLSVVDADMLIRYPHLGHTTRVQIEAADLLLLNKVDLVSTAELDGIEASLARVNASAPIIRTQHCRVDTDLIYGTTHERQLRPPTHVHQPEFASCTYTTRALLERRCFEQFADGLDPSVVRVKGFVCFAEGSFLFNFVAGRWELEPFAAEETALVFIGARTTLPSTSILNHLQQCEQ
jgi:G3E family GTPase